MRCGGRRWKAAGVGAGNIRPANTYVTEEASASQQPLISAYRRVEKAFVGSIVRPKKLSGHVIGRWVSDHDCAAGVRAGPNIRNGQVRARDRCMGTCASIGAP